MYQPVIPMSGLAGWRFLQRTYDTQFETFNKSTELKRDTDYFRENIGSISTAEDLVSDRRLMAVTLGAFGLQDDIDNRFFIRKMLEEGTTSDDALANRFTDPRYKEMSEAFGFGPGEFLKIGEAGFVDAIVARFEANSFEVAAGEQDDSMRIALYAQREVSELASADMSNDAKWFTLMGDPPMRALFEKALNLPSSIGQIDVDQQLGVFQERAQSVFGTDQIADFSDPNLVEDLITKYVVRNQISAFASGMSGQSIALTLLQS
ncbi:DUF1217 domain-containing protein [Sulfitobacter sp. S0837]|uniref:DUF1217 domain-containing protein n=1 Tax=Sulfitobacter maritimus TaxID=2741719 RepID=UPI001581D4B3|nr:DUF1217 domain-containing protein [Sulfitobacter maritimus]NUH66789.1 DUF1217 domain-containing protein [Sulfitobacter maritimus]